MAPVWKPRDTKILRDWIQTILFEASDVLTEWEVKFLNDMENIMDLGGRLSQGQEEKLEQIYAAKTS